MKISSKDLKDLNINNVIVSIIIDILSSRDFKYTDKNDGIEIAKKVLNNPENYINDKNWHKLVIKLISTEKVTDYKTFDIKDNIAPYSVFGKELISSDTISQMDTVMRTPIITGGALMPDAHAGYGLPIGGVISTLNSVIPYAVGYDIGCRMSLTVYDADPKFFKQYEHRIVKAIETNTHFGNEGGLDKPIYHEILDDPLFQTPFLKTLHKKAVKQIGSSGQGNHFISMGIVVIDDNNNGLGLPVGKYIGLLSHSGSRNLGFKIAEKYYEISKNICRLPSSIKNMAWLDLDTELGNEYWLAMDLAGSYAKACHDNIHYSISKYLGLKPIKNIENHHNFAWKEDGMVIHRKGATPAKKGVLGIIPGDMVHNAYIVSGLGNVGSLNSASHGAGRVLSRGEASNSISNSSMKKILKEFGVTLIGGGTDEAPDVYKNIDEVMIYQKELVKTEGVFSPKIVRMGEDGK